MNDLHKNRKVINIKQDAIIASTSLCAHSYGFMPGFYVLCVALYPRYSGVLSQSPNMNIWFMKDSKHTSHFFSPFKTCLRRVSLILLLSSVFPFFSLFHTFCSLCFIIDAWSAGWPSQSAFCLIKPGPFCLSCSLRWILINERPIMLFINTTQHLTGCFLKVYQR